MSTQKQTHLLPILLALVGLLGWAGAGWASSLPVTSGLTVWLDAEDVDGDGVIEGAGESYLSGGTATWADKSGNGYDATQTSSSLQPTYNLSVINGRAALHFDGADALRTGTVPMTPADKATVFVIAEVDVATWFGHFVAYGGNISGSERRWAMRLTGNSDFSTSPGTVSFINSDNNDGAGVPPVATFGSQGTGANLVGQGFKLLQGTVNTVSDWRIAENLVITDTGSSPALNTADSRIDIGARETSGGAGWEQFLDGDIAAVVIYNRVLSDEEAKLVSHRLADNYGLSIPEPSALVLLVTAGLMLVQRRAVRRWRGQK
jgi:hypothetical protein